jgi:hypothetical protein
MNDNRIPLAVDHKTGAELSFEESIAFNYLQIKGRIKEGENLITFTEIFWPVMLIQTEPSFKVMIDNVSISTQELKLTNAPRTAQLGHILRNPNWGNNKKLDLIIKEMKYENIEDFDIKDTDIKPIEKEYLINKVSGLMPAKFTQNIGKLLPGQIKFNINEVGHLDEIYNFDDSMVIAQKWFKSLEMVKGNNNRWRSVIQMITEPVEKWKTDLVVKIKDQKEIYKKAILNTKDLDETKIQNELNKQKDVMETWVLQEQKAISERIGKMFKGIDMIFEDLRNKNAFFLNIDLLRSKPVGEVVKNAYQNIANIRQGLEKSEGELYQISEKINAIRKEVESTSLSAEEKIELLNLELQNKKGSQEEEIRKLAQERGRKIDKYEEYERELEEKYKIIQELIQNKMQSCIADMKYLRDYQVDDQISLISKPTLRIFIPIGIGIIEDEDYEERIEIIFPSYVNTDLSRIPISEDIVEFESKISKILDSDMKLRSNYEFTAENAPNYNSNILSGLEKFRQKSRLTDEQFNEATALLKSIGS